MTSNKTPTISILQSHLLFKERLCRAVFEPEKGLQNKKKMSPLNCQVTLGADPIEKIVKHTNNSDIKKKKRQNSFFSAPREQTRTTNAV